MLKLLDSNEKCRRRIETLYADITANLSILSVKQLESKMRQIHILSGKILHNK